MFIPYIRYTDPNHLPCGQTMDCDILKQIDGASVETKDQLLYRLIYLINMLLNKKVITLSDIANVPEPPKFMRDVLPLPTVEPDPAGDIQALLDAVVDRIARRFADTYGRGESRD